MTRNTVRLTFTVRCAVFRIRIFKVGINQNNEKWKKQNMRCK